MFVSLYIQKFPPTPFLSIPIPYHSYPPLPSHTNQTTTPPTSTSKEHPHRHSPFHRPEPLTATLTLHPTLHLCLPTLHSLQLLPTPTISTLILYPHQHLTLSPHPAFKYKPYPLILHFSPLPLPPQTPTSLLFTPPHSYPSSTTTSIPILSIPIPSIPLPIPPTPLSYMTPATSDPLDALCVPQTSHRCIQSPLPPILHPTTFRQEILSAP